MNPTTTAVANGVFIGRDAGAGMTTGRGCVFIGDGVDGEPTRDFQLRIATPDVVLEGTLPEDVAVRLTEAFRAAIPYLTCKVSG